MNALEEIRGYSAYELARMAGCSSPDSLESEGARLLCGVRDAVVDRIEDGSITLDDLDDNGQLHLIADEAPDFRTYQMWLQFVDLGAYQEEPEFDDDWGSDLGRAAAVALYQIARRLACVLAEQWRDEWECPVCDGGYGAGCDQDTCGNPADDDEPDDDDDEEPDDQADTDTVVAVVPVQREATSPMVVPEVPEVPAQAVLTGPVDAGRLAAQLDPLWDLVHRQQETDAQIRAAQAARRHDRRMRRFYRRLTWVTVAVAVVAVGFVVWLGV